MILLNERIMAFNGIWERLDFDNLVPSLVGFMEAAQYSSTLQKAGTDVWESGQIPHLPETYWQDQSNREALHHHLIAAAVVMTSRKPGMAIPIDQWRCAMVKLDILSVETERVLNILSAGGTTPTMSLCDQASYAVSLLRTEEHPAPKRLFMCFFRLLNALGPLDKWASASLEEIAVERWTYAADSQRFAFFAPSTNCKLIKEKCADQVFHGYAKVASILEVAAIGLRMPLSEEVRNMLDEIKSHGKLIVSSM
jgi:hypothetical protein